MIVGRSRYKTYSLDISRKKRPSKVNTQEIQKVKKKIVVKIINRAKIGDLKGEVATIKKSSPSTTIYTTF